MANRVAVEFAVDETGKGRAALSELDERRKKIEEGAGTRDAWDDLISGASRAADKVNELENTIEDSFVKTKASAASAGEAYVKSLTGAQRQALSLQQSTRALGTDGARISAQAAGLQTRFAELYRGLSTGRPLSELNKELDESRVKLERLNQDAIALRSRQISTAAEAGGRTQLPQGLTSAIGLAGSRLGVSGAGTITGLLGAGGVAGGLGLGVAALAGIRELIKISSEAEQSQLNLALAARDTGHSFAEAAVTSEQFRAQMVADQAQANQLAGAFEQLQLRSGGRIGIGSTGAVSTLATARGLSPEDAAKALEGLSRGSKSAYEQLTGLDADLALDRYAKAAHRTVAELTDMERVQALWNGVQERSNDLADVAAARMQTLDSKWQNFKNTVADLASGIDQTLGASSDQLYSWLSGGNFGAGPEETYRRDVAQFDRQAAIDNARARATNKAKEEQAARDAQQTAARETGDFFDEFERGNRQARKFSPLDLTGLNIAERGEAQRARHEQELAQVAAEREQLSLEFNKFQSEASRYSADDLDRLNKKFEDSLAENADKSRAIHDQLTKEAAEAAAQIEQLVRSARDSVKNFLAESALAADKENPFSRIFISGRLEVEKTREQFRVFGKDFADQMAAVKQSTLDSDLALARFHSTVSALKDLQEARRLERGIIGPTGPEERRAGVVSAELTDITRRASLGREINFLENPFRRYGQFEQRRDLASELRDLQLLDVSGAGRGGRRAQSDAILQLTGSIDPRELATSGDPAIRYAREARLRALKDSREQSGLDVRDAIERERAGNQIQTDARELLAAVRASDLKDPVKLKEFLAASGSLSDKELTGDLRTGRAAALREAAHQEGQQQKRAEAQAKLLFGVDGTGGVIGKLNNLISAKGIKVDAGPAATVNISAKDAGATAAQLGPAMSRDNEADAAPAPVPGFAPGFRQ